MPITSKISLNSQMCANINDKPIILNSVAIFIRLPSPRQKTFAMNNNKEVKKSPKHSVDDSVVFVGILVVVVVVVVVVFDAATFAVIAPKELEDDCVNLVLVVNIEAEVFFTSLEEEDFVWRDKGVEFIGEAEESKEDVKWVWELTQRVDVEDAVGEEVTDVFNPLSSVVGSLRGNEELESIGKGGV